MITSTIWDPNNKKKNADLSFLTIKWLNCELCVARSSAYTLLGGAIGTITLWVPFFNQTCSFRNIPSLTFRWVLDVPPLYPCHHIDSI